MKNSIKVICIFVFLLISISFWAFRTEASKLTEISFSSNESARALYLNNCARCHGADGKSETELGRLNDAPDISGGKARRISGAKLTRLITKGRDSMPAFGKKLTKTQIASIIGYIRGL